MSQPTTIAPVANRRVVLALTTGAATRPVITIDGRDYAIDLGMDWNIFQQRRYTRITQRLADLDALAEAKPATEYTDEESNAAELAFFEGYGDIIANVLPTLPREALAGLDLTQRQQIVEITNQLRDEARERDGIALAAANARIAAEDGAATSPETPAAPASPLPQRGKPKRAKQPATA